MNASSKTKADRTADAVVFVPGLVKAEKDQQRNYLIEGVSRGLERIRITQQRGT